MKTAVVLDTNVFVAAAFNPSSTSAEIIAAVREGRLLLVSSDETRAETEHILRQIPPVNWTDFEGLFDEAKRCEGRLDVEAFAFIPDASDRKFAALADATSAALVTMDDHLLAVREKAGVSILRPEEFWRRQTSGARFVPLQFTEYPVDEMKARANEFHREVRRRRTVRDFADRSVPREVIEECIRAAGTAPSGANMQPWHFAVVSDATTKRRIRQAAEEEERDFYNNRAPQEWLDALAPLGTDECKEFLETAPYLIAVFVENYGVREDGTKVKHYYATESVGIATGILITALHWAGLATLTHTPSPMGFLNNILGRPGNERPFLLLVTGYPADDAEVPDIPKKNLNEIAMFDQEPD